MRDSYPLHRCFHETHYTMKKISSHNEDVARNVTTEFLAENETEEIQEIRPEQIGLEPELLATLTPKNATEIEVSKTFAIEYNLLPEKVFYLPMNDYYLTQNQEWDEHDEYGRHKSLISKGISYISKGRYESIGEIISDGIHIAKREVIELSEQATLTAYTIVDTRLDEARAKWENRFERKDD